MAEPTTVTAGSWLLPSVKAVVDNQGEIKTLFENVSAVFKGSRIAITGTVGVGKTVLFDHLTGKAPRIGYVSPGRSQRVEKKLAKPITKRIGLLVVPGQNAEPRRQALQELFNEDPGVDGVIHVVDNGYAELRQEDSVAILKQQGITTIEDFLAHQRTEELAELDETLRQIEQSHTKHKKAVKPKWMIVAVAKVDLYHDVVDDVRSYYVGNAQSPFVEKLNHFADRVGRNNFRWEALPVCTFLDDFEFNGHVVRPKLTEPERDVYLKAFAREMVRYCGK